MRFPASIVPGPKGFIVSAVIVILLVLYVAFGHAIVDLTPPLPRAKDVPMTQAPVPAPAPSMQITLDMVAQMCNKLTKNEDLPLQCEMGTTPEGAPGIMFLFLNRQALSALWVQVANTTVGPFCSIHNKATTEAFVSVSLLEEKIYRIAECHSGQLSPWMPWAVPQLEEKEDE